jgi:hypothetical protein
MIKTASQNPSRFPEDLLKQLAMIGKILVRPFPSTFRSILDHPNLWLTGTIVLLVIAQLGFSTMELVKGNVFYDEWTIAIPLLLMLFAFTTDVICREVFRRQNHLFKPLFLAFVAIYFASMLINGVLIVLTLPFDSFPDIAQRLILMYQIALAVVAVHAIAGLSLWKSTVALILGGAIAALGFIFIGPIVDTLFHLV